jgi:outer membrane protein assembly factor BamB
MGLVNAIPDRHDVVSEFKIPEGGEGPTWAHPVVCGGRLYIRHGDFLYAYDVRGTDR